MAGIGVNIFIDLFIDRFTALIYCLVVMANKTLKTLTGMEIASRLINLKPGQSFSVNGNSNRMRVLAAAKTLRDGGTINHAVTSRQSENGEYVIFIAPE